MIQSLILNKNHIVENSNNSVLRYNFPKNELLENFEIGIKSIDLYNSIFNISENQYQNSRFQYRWFDASGNLTTLHTITIPDGFYDTISLNEYLQSQMIIRSHCLVDTNGINYLFFIKIQDNLNRYAVQLDLTRTYTHAQATAGMTINSIVYRYPSIRQNNWKFNDTLTITPQINFLTTSNFNLILGFNKQFYPTTSNSTTSISFLSENVPIESPVSSIVIRCNLVRNDFCNPNDVLHSFILQSDFGFINNERPTEITFFPITNGTYNMIELSMFDQDLRRISIRDNQMLFNLLLRKKEVKPI